MAHSFKKIFKNSNEIYTGNLESTYRNWNILNYPELYINKVSDSQRKEYTHILSKKTIFHTYWNGYFGVKQAFSIKSFLCTQDPESTELWLWLDEKNNFTQVQNNRYLLELKDKIRILPWNIENEILNTPFQILKKQLNSPKPLAEKGDDFRIISLSKYGGVYFDLDVMFLKDFAPLLKGHEFVYAWEYQPYANSAILYLRKGSYITNYLSKKLQKKKVAMPWVLFNYKDKKLSYLRNYPCTFFDPLWGGYTNDMPFKEFYDFFREFTQDFQQSPLINSYKDFFPGAFTYHWHNKWDAKEYENSYFGIFNKEFEHLLSL